MKSKFKLTILSVITLILLSSLTFTSCKKPDDIVDNYRYSTNIKLKTAEQASTNSFDIMASTDNVSWSQIGAILPGYELEGNYDVPVDLTRFFNNTTTKLVYVKIRANDANGYILYSPTVKVVKTD